MYFSPKHFVLSQLNVNGESAWTWNGERNQFYLHTFGERMPDLNLRNALVRQELRVSSLCIFNKWIPKFNTDTWFLTELCKFYIKIYCVLNLANMSKFAIQFIYPIFRYKIILCFVCGKMVTYELLWGGTLLKQLLLV